MNDQVTNRRWTPSALTLLALALGTLATSNAQTNAPAPVPTQVVILGTLHGSHRTSTNYSLEVLRKVIVAMKPAAILVEQPPDTRRPADGARRTRHQPGRQRGEYRGEPGGG